MEKEEKWQIERTVKKLREWLTPYLCLQLWGEKQYKENTYLFSSGSNSVILKMHYVVLGEFFYVTE